MDAVTLTNATVLKFHRKERKWREKGRGDVRFLLKGDELVVGLGKQSFFVKGGLRPKGPNAIVMRVWGIEASSNEPDVILAVRFGEEQDSKRLFELLPDKMLDKRLLGASRKSRKSVKSIPWWFASLEGSKRNSIKKLIWNADSKHLSDGSFQMQLVKMYDFSHRQIEELIDAFRPRRTVNKIHKTPIGDSGLSTLNGNPSDESGKEGSSLQISRLTEQNLLIYNRMKPPLKGDFRTIVNTWLQRSVP
jgi:hypothetical protein